jgi:hypothetical protein
MSTDSYDKGLQSLLDRISAAPAGEHQWLYRRYATLVDKQFASVLSESEQAELGRLQEELDEVESELYQPVKEKLQAALAAVRKASIKG